MEKYFERLLHVSEAKNVGISSICTCHSLNKVVFEASLMSPTVSDDIKNLWFKLCAKMDLDVTPGNGSWMVTDPDDFTYYIYFKDDEVTMAIPREELPMAIENVFVEETNEFYKANGTGCPNPNYRFIFVDGTVVDYNDSSYTSDQTRYSMSIEYWDGKKEDAYWGKAVDTKKIYSEISESNPYIKLIIKDYVIYPFYKEEDEKLKEVGFK